MCMYDVDTSESSDENLQHAKHVAQHCMQHLTLDNADSGSSTVNPSASQTLAGLKHGRHMQRQLTSSPSSVRCDDVLIHKQSVRCVRSSQCQQTDDHMQRISSHFCVSCRQLMVSQHG